jgi:dTDP-4-dehydrorhamnose reductase
VRILITGAAGQLGSSLQKTVPPGLEVTALTHMQLDIASQAQVKRVIESFKPQVVVNTAAFTAVDKAESEKDRAFDVNARGPEILAEAAGLQGARLIHISTDFVFDGLKSQPYQILDARHPLGIYGASKKEGEERVQNALEGSSVIIRTGWVYAAQGRNFVNTILQLLTEQQTLDVIADQVGTPTWAMSLAKFVWAVVDRAEIKGFLHWSDAGVASWYDFAVAIQEEAMSLGLIRKAVCIRPIAAKDYPLPAKRPYYSVLDKEHSMQETGMVPRHWRSNLRLMLEELVHA